MRSGGEGRGAEVGFKDSTRSKLHVAMGREKLMRGGRAWVWGI